jgi:Zn ribbon nucleic-acid-binding protein
MKRERTIRVVEIICDRCQDSLARWRSETTGKVYCTECLHDVDDEVFRGPSPMSPVDCGYEPVEA